MYFRKCDWGGDQCGMTAKWVLVYGCPGNHGDQIGEKWYCVSHYCMWMDALKLCFCGTLREWECQMISQ